MTERTQSADQAEVGKSAPYHHGDLRRALTDAALDLIGEKGPKGFTLTEVARRAGVSVAAPYRHFADKSDLVATVAQRGFEQLRVALLAAPSGRDRREHLVNLGRAYVRWALDHPDFYLVMFGAEVDQASHSGLGLASKAAFDVLLGAIEAARSDGALRTKDARALAGSLWSVVHGAASLDIGGDLHRARIEASPEDLVEEAITALTAPGQCLSKDAEVAGREAV